MSVRSLARSTIVGLAGERNLNKLSYDVEYLVVAGGGGGGNTSAGVSITRRGGGSGGAGGYRTNVRRDGLSGTNFSSEDPLSLQGVFPITVGAGGPNNTNGDDSVLGPIVSLGGGFGAGVGGDGGSGGGANQGDPAGLGTPGQGTDGATLSGSLNNHQGGGGGGAAFPANGRIGGLGQLSYITGTGVVRATGGTALTTTSNGAPGDPNTGDGGGGATITSQTSRTGGTGGSGVIIFRLDPQVPVAFSVGVTEENGGAGVLVGDKQVYVVTAAGPTDTVTIG